MMTVELPEIQALSESLTQISENEMSAWLELPAAQQPPWPDEWQTAKARTALAGMPPLVSEAELAGLRALLADAAMGRYCLIQAGDCAEDPDDCTPGPLRRKAELLEGLAGLMGRAAGVPALKVGRIAGQFAKPRSKSVEETPAGPLPAYRGPMVNRPEPTDRSRRPDPARILDCYQAASSAMAVLRAQDGPAMAGRLWTSHEALVLDYELPLVRRNALGELLLTSTHWPWIGERTRNPDGAHVRLLAQVVNPVACKVGATATAAEVLRLCEVLDPHRIPGRLTLIARFGAGQVAHRLPALVEAVARDGHPVLWLCDPMHGNTTSLPDGCKTRAVKAVLHEAAEFQTAVRAAGSRPAGLHLEVTPEKVLECHGEDGLVGRRTSLCDPRLNSAQAALVARAWQRF
ncbi:phenazine biosynthesis protein PhzC [Streptomyces lincolnensis]|uniref:Phospho-2-dehydro-3-deoxyheptonate aldolase n=2 Tax=Streptomyces lincolnensis TaxID=1915 RepID=A0A1B1MGI5_STRLN|nr:3-deoxy-7-phosphoheptulonate synthase [Streptomyces lincolnensis]ANS67681.1 phenazine biosynthesis protein PhzC [Streptomyces lincolnensis]AXG54996.1 phenazine biosynthesis protein PhzC [Streptomyces lincolnensis]